MIIFIIHANDSFDRAKSDHYSLVVVARGGATAFGGAGRGAAAAAGGGARRVPPAFGFPSPNGLETNR